jgi:DNA-binding CsgD family transcriptional regulator
MRVPDAAHAIPVHRCAELLGALTGAEPSPGFVHGMLACAAAAVRQAYQLVPSLIITACSAAGTGQLCSNDGQAGHTDFRPLPGSVAVDVGGTCERSHICLLLGYTGELRYLQKDLQIVISQRDPGEPRRPRKPGNGLRTLERGMASQRNVRQPVPSATHRVVHLTSRQVEVLRLAGRGLSGKQIARHLGISVRTVEDHFSALRQRTGAHNQGELIAYWAAAGLVKPGLAVPEPADSGTAAMAAGSGGGTWPENQGRNGVPSDPLRDEIRDDQLVNAPPAYHNSVRIGYVRISPRTQDHQAQLEALATAHCREVVIETASTRDAWPKLNATLAALRAGDTLVIYKPDRIAWSIKELLVLLEDQLHACGINLHILAGICHGRGDGARPDP